MPYIPRKGTLPQRVCEYFHQVPKEELTATEIASKFVVSLAAVEPSLAAAVKNGALQEFKDGDGKQSYRAGGNLKDIPREGHSADASKSVSPFNVWLKQKGESSAEGRPTRAPLPDPTTIQIESGIELPPAPPPKPKKLSFTSVFEKMKPGDSFSIEADAATRVIQVAGRYAKKQGAPMKFTLRQYEDGKARIWRVA